MNIQHKENYKNLTWCLSTKSAQASFNVPKSRVCPSVTCSQWSLSSTHSMCGVESLVELCLAPRSLHLRWAEAITAADVHDVQISPLGDSTATSINRQSNYTVSVPLAEEPESCRWIQRERERERESVCVCERESESVCVCVCERERECVCVCVCVCERERECVWERERECVRERESKREWESVWERDCVWDRERERVCEREREREWESVWERESESESVCERECVCERERERERVSQKTSHQETILTKL